MRLLSYLYVEIYRQRIHIDTLEMRLVMLLVYYGYRRVYRRKVYYTLYISTLYSDLHTDIIKFITCACACVFITFTKIIIYFECVAVSLTYF